MPKLAIGGSDDGWYDLRVSSHVTLNRGIHVLILKQDEVLAAKAISLLGFRISSRPYQH